MVRSQFARVQPRPLLIVLAAVFAGLSVVLVVAAAVTATPLVLLAAVPLAMTSLLMWYQGTGRLAPGLFRGGRRRRRRRRTRTTVGGASRTARHRGSDGGRNRWETTFRDEVSREARTRARRRERRRERHHTRDETVGRGGSSTSGTWRDRRGRSDRLGGLTRPEAYDVLGLDPSASDETVRETYREKAKRAHPDTEGGSTESFQELNDAYERLIDG